jgi:hypothetical protein
MKKILVLLSMAILITGVACVRIIPSSPSNSPSLPSLPTTPTIPRTTNQLPIAKIDAILPGSVTAGDSVTFSGHGTDVDGTIVGYEWRSSIDGFLSNLASFMSSSLSVGTHIIYFKVKDSALDWSDEVSGSVIVVPRMINRPVIQSFAAVPTAINLGGSAVLSWSVLGANIVTIDNGIGPVSPSGMQAVYPARSTFYTLTATNQAGSVTQTVRVDVVSVPQYLGYPVISYFTATSYGSYVMLSWSVSNASEVSIDPYIGPVPAVGQVNVTLPATYTLTARNSYGYSTSRVTVYSR